MHSVTNTFCPRDQQDLFSWFKVVKKEAKNKPTMPSKNNPREPWRGGKVGSKDYCKGVSNIMTTTKRSDCGYKTDESSGQESNTTGDYNVKTVSFEEKKDGNKACNWRGLAGYTASICPNPDCQERTKQQQLNQKGAEETQSNKCSAASTCDE